MASRSKAEREKIAATREAARRTTLGLPVSDDVAALAAQTAEERKDADLDNHETQWAILNPEVLTYQMFFADGRERKLCVRTEFTMADAFKRRIFDRMSSFAMLVHHHARIAMARVKDADLAAAMALFDCAEDARQILVQISYFEDDNSRPTIDELAEGMSSADTGALSDVLLRFYDREVERRKKVRAKPATG